MKKVILGVTTGIVCFGIICMTRVAVKAASVTGSGTTATGAISSSCIQKTDGCNTCARQPGSENRACTMMACVDASGAALPPQSETCLAWTNDLPTSPVACTMEYAPVCASVQVQCITAPCPPIQQTFGNACSMNANSHATFLYTGECGSAVETGVVIGTGVIVGGDKDSHGCIGSAGYSWDIIAQQCLRSRENPTSGMKPGEGYQYWKVAGMLNNAFSARSFTPLQQQTHIQEVITKIDSFLQTSRLKKYRLDRMQRLKSFLQVYAMGL